jgi:hypothetical protein
MVVPTVAGEAPRRFVRLFVEGERQILGTILALVRDVDGVLEILQETSVDLGRKFDRYAPAFPVAPLACRFEFRQLRKHREQKAR